MSFPWSPKDALGLPPGSVRAVVFLSLTAMLCFAVGYAVTRFMNEGIAGQLVDLFKITVSMTAGYYFAKSGAKDGGSET